MSTCKRCGYNPSDKNRSTPQNSAYWKLIVEPLAEYLALEKYKVHEMLKYRFLKEIHYKNKRDGSLEEIIVTRDSKSLTTKEFQEYCSQIRIWASMLGCYLLEPNEQLKES